MKDSNINKLSSLICLNALRLITKKSIQVEMEEPPGFKKRKVPKIFFGDILR